MSEPYEVASEDPRVHLLMRLQPATLSPEEREAAAYTLLNTIDAVDPLRRARP